jgi:hypothetical protein
MEPVVAGLKLQKWNSYYERLDIDSAIMNLAVRQAANSEVLN